MLSIPKLYQNNYRQETTITGSGSGVANELSQQCTSLKTPRVQNASIDLKQDFSSFRRPTYEKSQESSRSNSRSNIQSSINRRKRLKKSAGRGPKQEESGISSPSGYSRVSPSRHGSRRSHRGGGNQIRDLVHLAK